MNKLDEFLNDARLKVITANYAPQSIAEQDLADSLERAVRLVEAQRAELDRLFTMAQTGKTFAGIAGNATIEAKFEKGEI